MIFREAIVAYSDNNLKSEQNDQPFNVKPNVTHNVFEGYSLMWFLTRNVAMESNTETNHNLWWKWYAISHINNYKASEEDMFMYIFNSPSLKYKTCLLNDMDHSQSVIAW
jgi:hypothetical protein